MHYWEEEYFDSQFDEKQAILNELAKEEYIRLQHEWDRQRIVNNSLTNVSKKWTDVIKCRYGDNVETSSKERNLCSKQAI